MEAKQRPCDNFGPRVVLGLRTSTIGFPTAEATLVVVPQVLPIMVAFNTVIVLVMNVDLPKR